VMGEATRRGEREASQPLLLVKTRLEGRRVAAAVAKERVARRVTLGEMMVVVPKDRPRVTTKMMVV
jgi:hypothetical protein